MASLRMHIEIMTVLILHFVNIQTYTPKAEIPGSKDVSFIIAELQRTCKTDIYKIILTDQSASFSPSIEFQNISSQEL